MHQANHDPRNLPPIPGDWLQAAADSLADALAARLRSSTPPQQEAPVSPYLSVGEAAEMLRCRPQRVYDLLSRRRISRFKDGSRVLVSRSELEAYLNDGSTTAR